MNRAPKGHAVISRYAGQTESLWSVETHCQTKSEAETMRALFIRNDAGKQRIYKVVSERIADRLSMATR
jgi:hypothetical protein